MRRPGNFDMRTGGRIFVRMGGKIDANMHQFELRKKARRSKGFILAVDTAMTLMVKRQVPLGDHD
jgi:hypothetical protein